MNRDQCPQLRSHLRRQPLTAAASAGNNSSDENCSVALPSAPVRRATSRRQRWRSFTAGSNVSSSDENNVSSESEKVRGGLHRRRSFTGASGHRVTILGGESGVSATGLSTQPDTVDQLMQIITTLQHTVRFQSAQIESMQRTMRDQSHKIKTLQHEVRNLERWAVLAAPIPGWGENAGFSNAMQGFLANFKKQIIEICNGESNGQICFNAPEGFGPWFDYGVLLPYWKELGEAMQRPFTAGNISTSFHLKDIKLGKTVLDLLAPGLMTTYFKILSFDNNRFGRDGITFLMDVIEHNPSLETFYLMRNPIEKNEDVNRLCDLIRHHPSLKRVVIEECGSWTPSDLLCPIITASGKLRSISLEGNNISTMGRANLSDFLASNLCLEVLNLKENQLNDDDAVLIANALESNNTLTWLDLEANNITSVGKDALFRTIFNPESLNSVADSNHTCGFNLNVNGALELPSIINVKYGSLRLAIEMKLLAPNTVRKMKLLALISAPYERSVNIHLLDGVPLELMPEVLEFVQQYPEVAYNFPDGLHTRMHWGYMSELRPDAPQSECESNKDGHHEGGNIGIGAVDDEDVSISTERAKNEDGELNYVRDDWSRDYDDDSDEECDPKPARMKRLNIVFEITRGWKMETGEPLCAYATSYHMQRASVWHDSCEFGFDVMYPIRGVEYSHSEIY